MTRVTLDAWPERLEAVASTLDPPLGPVVVLEETDSTQDAARRLALPVGAVVTTGRQRAGRGRLGRSWHDTGDEGLAVTLVRPEAEASRLTLAYAVAVARFLETRVADAVCLRWPNDVMVGARKIAGILIECRDGVAHCGIGLNVGQESWPPALAGVAVSMRQLGAAGERLDVLAELLPTLVEAERLPEGRLDDAFAARDGLVGTTASFRVGRELITGRVERVEARAGLRIRVDGRSVWLPAATTRNAGGPDG
ncbi:MAG: biotin--[acetyl-CoA-carboxylase] ligase [Phycisphaerales bacterium]|nr:biotin--[acetyl-CoA-carboxylase] ligase [Phycisphaerales bacterium]